MFYIEKCLKVSNTQINLCWRNIWYPRAHHSHGYNYYRRVVKLTACLSPFQLNSQHTNHTTIPQYYGPISPSPHRGIPSTFSFNLIRLTNFSKQLQKSDYQPSKVRPSVRTDHRVSHRTDLHEIAYVGILLNFFHIPRSWLKSDQNNRHFTGRPMQVEHMTNGNVYCLCRTYDQWQCLLFM
jgi:hypothetical protein